MYYPEKNCVFPISLKGAVSATPLFFVYIWRRTHAHTHTQTQTQTQTKTELTVE